MRSLLGPEKGPGWAPKWGPVWAMQWVPSSVPEWVSLQLRGGHMMVRCLTLLLTTTSDDASQDFEQGSAQSVQGCETWVRPGHCACVPSGISGMRRTANKTGLDLFELHHTVRNNCCLAREPVSNLKMVEHMVSLEVRSGLYWRHLSPMTYLQTCVVAQMQTTCKL